MGDGKDKIIIPSMKTGKRLSALSLWGVSVPVGWQLNCRTLLTFMNAMELVWGQWRGWESESALELTVNPFYDI